MHTFFTNVYGYTFGVFFYYLLLVWRGFTTAHPRTTNIAGVVMLVLLLLTYLFEQTIYDIGLSIYLAYSVVFLIVKYRIESTILNWDVFKSSGNLYLHLLAIATLVSIMIMYCLASYIPWMQLVLSSMTLIEFSVVWTIWAIALFYHCSNKAYA